ncbi:MAG: HD domain-containing protein, partial [Nitrospirae bacterium]|nr:HD domain-containing protein [Nitrospirota bacterium]
GVAYVYIDTDKGLDVVSDKEECCKEGKGPPARVPATSAKDAPKQPEDKAYTDYILAMDDMLQVDKLSLIEATSVGFELFVKTGMDIVPLTATRNKKGDSVITREMLNAPGELLIYRSDAKKYREYLTEAMNAVSAAQSQVSKNMLIKENAKMLVHDLFNDPGSPAKMEACKDTVENVISSIIDTKGLITNLFTVNKHDYYVYTHSVNVSVFSVATAIALGIQAEGELFAIGMGSLLHDIGMSTIPPEVLHKPLQRLTDFEVGLLRGHVYEGLDIVKLYKGITPETLLPLLEHHENLMGTGYPVGLKGDKLHLSGRIISVTNTYDQLTTSRPGFNAISPFEALTYLRDHKDLYDADILKEFITVLGKSGQ